MIEIDKLYFHELDKWCRNNSGQEEYFAVFSERVANQLEMAVSNDQRIITPINKLIKNYDYLEFTNKVQHRSRYKSRLKKVVRLLADYQFISVKNCQDLIDKMEHFYLYDRFDSFIKSVQQTQKNQQTVLDAVQIQRIWRNIIEKNFEEIWAFLASKRIYDLITMKLYEICQPCIKKYSIQKINQIKDYNEHNIKYLKETRQIPSTIQDLFSASIHHSHNHRYNESINSYITERSLFLNQLKMEQAFQLINNIITTIKIGTSFGKTLTYELYGSIRTGFAIIGESDGDININPTKDCQLNRTEKIQYLSEIYQALRNNQYNKLNYSGIQAFTFEKIKVPFIKLKFQQGKNAKCVLKHVDLIVSSPNGVENSKILQMYSKNQYIVKFCNLIKLWAKRKTLINPKMPIQGFSSYGVVLMSIFYLIKTDQAPFVIQTTNGYRLQKNLLKQKDCKSLLQNFMGFLQFYKPNGAFFAEKMTVCLMSTTNTSSYDKYLINMYDFTDKSNPGRMYKNLSDKFFKYVNLASKMLENQCDICQIMSEVMI